MHSVRSTSRSNMMKFAFALVAVLALASPLQAYKLPSTGSGALAKELQDFLDLVPLEEIKPVVSRYRNNDKEVQAMMKYLHSEDFKQLISDIEAMPEIKKIMDYMQSKGLDIYLMVNNLNKRLNLKPLTPPSNVQMVRATSGIRGMLDEIEALIPMNKVKELYRNKMTASKVWADFVAQLMSPGFQNVANRLCNNANFKDLLHYAKNAQVDVDSVVRVIENALGVKITCKS